MVTARAALPSQNDSPNVVKGKVKYLARMRLKSVHCRMLMAERWAELPELHGLERDFMRELAGLRYALCL